MRGLFSLPAEAPPSSRGWAFADGVAAGIVRERAGNHPAAILARDAGLPAGPVT